MKNTPNARRVHKKNCACLNYLITCTFFVRGFFVIEITSQSVFAYKLNANRRTDLFDVIIVQ